MIEISNLPGALTAIMLHSTESGRFLPCTRVEFERLAAMIKRGELDPFLSMAETSAVADGSANWARAGLPSAERLASEAEERGRRFRDALMLVLSDVGVNTSDPVVIASVTARLHTEATGT